MIKKAIELQIGDNFKDHGQRKFRQFIKWYRLPDQEGIPPEHLGKLLIIYATNNDGCCQMVEDPNKEFIVE